MTIKQLKLDLESATLETALTWNSDSEKTLFFYEFCSERVSAFDANIERLREIFENAMLEILDKAYELEETLLS